MTKCMSKFLIWFNMKISVLVFIKDECYFVCCFGVVIGVMIAIKMDSPCELLTLMILYCIS